MPATSQLARAALLSVAYFGAAQIGSALSLPHSFATFWPPSGLLLAVLLRSEPHVWPWLVLATCPANLAFDALHGRPLLVSFSYWTGNVCEALAGAWMLRQMLGTPFTLRRVRHVVTFVALAALGSTMVSATIGAWTTLLWQGAGPYGSLWRLWWLANATGVLVFAPVVLAWTEPVLQGLSKEGRREWFAFLVVVVGLSGLVIARRHVPWFPPRALVVVAVPMLGWATWRLGPRGTTIGLLALVPLGIKNHLDGVGILATGGTVTPEAVLMVQALLNGIVVTFLLGAAGIAEWHALERELRQANRVKREFVSTISHEFRTPLTAILGYIEMARDTTFGPAQRRAFLDDIERAGRQLLELIEATLDVGRLEAGRDEPRLEPVSLPAFWQDLRSGCATIPRQAGVELRWGDAIPDLVLVTDPRKLTIVMRNLITNALKFTERGWVRIDVARETSAVLFLVQDTGIGIQPDDHARIFEMYRQADGSDTRRFGGTGLGLHIVRRFLEQLGGTITLESVPGQGSTFTIRLPGAAAARTAA